MAEARNATSLIPEGTPEELKSIIVSCIAMDPTERPTFADICKYFDSPSLASYFN
jgi:hypothetical protein